MARGWESKSVELQIDSAEGVQPRTPSKRSAADLALAGQKQGLLLSRTRVWNELHSATNPRHKAMLEKALADLDARLGALTRKASA